MIHWIFLIWCLLGVGFSTSAMNETEKQWESVSREPTTLSSNTCNCKEVIRPSSIALYSPCGNIYVKFCELWCLDHPPTSNIDTQINDSMFQSALIYTTDIKEIGGIPLKRFRETKAYYWCMHLEESYSNLDRFLENYAENIDSSSSDEEEENQIQFDPGKCQTSSLDMLVDQILDSDTVCFSFGAGISAGYIPTLLDLFNGWGLEKIVSKDCATKESLIRFARKFINDPQETLGMVRRDYMKIFLHKIESTPAHLALKKLIDVLKNHKKDIYIYTDNQDGIERNVGIWQSFKYIDDHTCMVDLPQLNQRKAAVVVCGLSFDFNNILSTLYTRRSDGERVSFFSLNIEPNNIAVSDGFDSDKNYECFRKGESMPFINYNSPIMGMLCVPGSLQDTLPTLYNFVKERLNQ